MMPQAFARSLLAIAMSLLLTGCTPETVVPLLLKFGWSDAELMEDLRWAITTYELPAGDVTVWLPDADLNKGGPPDPLADMLPKPDGTGPHVTRTFRVFPERQEVVEVDWSVTSLSRCSDLVSSEVCAKGCVVADNLNWECWHKTPRGLTVRDTRKTMSKGILTVTEIAPDGHPYTKMWLPLPRANFRRQVIAAWFNLSMWWAVHGPGS